MDSSPFFLYYNPENPKATTSSSRSHAQFVSQPPSTSNSSKPTATSPMPFAPQPISAHQSSFLSINMPNKNNLSPADLHHLNTGLLTPSSPPLTGMDGDMYFYPTSADLPHTPALSVSDSFCSIDSECGTGAVTPLELQLPHTPSTPQMWKERTPMSPGLSSISSYPSPHANNTSQTSTPLPCTFPTPTPPQ